MLIVFWLAPVALLLVLILLVISLRHDRPIRPLIIIEPIGLLVTGWQLARFEPNNGLTDQVIKQIASNHLSNGSLLEQIIRSVSGRLKTKAKIPVVTVQEQRSVGPLAEQFIIDIGSKTQSVVIGPIEQIAGIIADEKLSKFSKLSHQSSQNGYLSLVVASSFIHKKTDQIKHSIIGLAILEPVMNESQVSQLQHLGQANARFLSVAPTEFIGQLFERVFTAEKILSVDTAQLKSIQPPKFAEAELEQAQVVGNTDLASRHLAVRVWQRTHDCRVASSNPDDRDLPISPINYLS